jgi:MoaA/NifB/PqqE/SkfB family radical SAM enzyme
MCFNWRNLDAASPTRELSLEEVAKIARGMKGLHSLIVSGGEPFLRPDLGDVIALFYERAGVRHISIPSNMFCPDTAERVRDLALRFPEAFIRILAGLDGVGAAHDEIRRHPGGFSKLAENLDRIRAYKRDLPNLSLNIVTVLSSLNAGRVGEVVAFARARGDIDDVKIIALRGSPRSPEVAGPGPADYLRALRSAEEASRRPDRTPSFYNNLFSSASMAAKEAIYEFLRSGRMRVRCNAGRRFLVISHDGEVFPCEILGRSMGSLRENGYRPDKILESPAARDILETIRRGACACTMDCNAISSVIYSPRLYPRVLGKLARFYLPLPRRRPKGGAPAP